MKVINGYVIDGDLKTDNSGFSKWAFAKKRTDAIILSRSFWRRSIR